MASAPAAAAASTSSFASLVSPLWLMPASAMTKQGRPSPISRPAMVMCVESAIKSSRPSLDGARDDLRLSKGRCRVVEEALLGVELEAREQVDDRLTRIRPVIDGRRGVAAVRDLLPHGTENCAALVRGVRHVLCVQTSLLPRADVDDRRAEIRALLDARRRVADQAGGPFQERDELVHRQVGDEAHLV